MGDDTPPAKAAISLDALKNPKAMVAAAIAAVGGLLYVGGGFTIEFSTCDDPVEEAEVVVVEPEKPEEAEVPAEED